MKHFSNFAMFDDRQYEMEQDPYANRQSDFLENIVDKIEGFELWRSKDRKEETEGDVVILIPRSAYISEKNLS